MSDERITMKQLHQHMQSLGKSEIILDVRERDEYAQGHVPGSVNIPHEEVAKHADELRAYRRVYIHCQGGKRAQLAFSQLQKCGLANLVCISDGGMADWITAGYAVSKGT